MADFDFDQFDSYSDGPSAGFGAKARNWVHIAGAVSSVALILGLGIWGYKLAVRDVAGVPVMRAMSGAMRIAPADPGGVQAINQGLTVNAVAAMGSAVPDAGRIVLAPEPTALTSEDQPVQQAEAAAVEPLMLQDTEAAAASETSLIDSAVAEASAPTDETYLQPDSSALDNPNVIRVSLRPEPRPAGLAPMKIKAVQEVAGMTGAPARTDFTVADAAAIPPGTPLVQFGVFESPEAARESFGVLLASYPEIMGGLTPMIEAAQTGGRNFYRLRAEGYETLDAAREFCRGIPSSLTDCIPVVKK